MAARKPEQRFWQQVRPHILDLDPVRIESIGQGVPDVNCSLGWIELKVAKMPKRRTSIVALPHFRPAQRAWLLRRFQRNGPCWTLTLVGDQWVLLDGYTSAQRLGHATIDELEAIAVTWWIRAPQKGQLASALYTSAACIRVGGALA